MQFKTALIAALLSATSLAAPTPTEEKNMMATTSQWCIKSMKRVCNTADTSCTWSFGINNGATTTQCSFTVTGSPADETSTSGITCGIYTVSSGWSGQFGPGNGFTTLSVVDWTDKLIVWPAYTDKQLAGGAVVTPDQCYTPSTLS